MSSETHPAHLFKQRPALIRVIRSGLGERAGEDGMEAMGDSSAGVAVGDEGPLGGERNPSLGMRPPLASDCSGCDGCK